MRKFKLPMLLVLAFILVLSACSSNDNQGSEKPPANENGGSEGGSGEETSKKLDLKFFVHASNNSALPSKDKDFVKQIIEEKFNVNLTIDHMEIGGDFHTKLNLMLAGGGSDMPDLFMAGGAESNTYIMDDLVKDMTEFVTPEKMPNYFKNWMDEDALSRYHVQNKFMRAPVPYGRTLYTSYYIRKDWIDNLNEKGIDVKIPETYEEMEKVMQHFTFDDPNNSGSNDTYGFTTYGNGTLVYVTWPQYLKYGLYGLMLDGDEFVDGYSDLKVQYVLDDVRDWMDQGIVDPDWFLQKGGEDLNKAAQGKAGIIQSTTRVAAFDNDQNSIQYKTKEILRNAGRPDEAEKVDWQPFHPFKDEGVGVTALPGTPFMFGKDTSDEKVERIIEILDWMASEEGFLLLRYGQEDVHYTRNGNTIELNTEKYEEDIVKNGNFLNIYQFFALADEPHVLGIEVIRPSETDRDRAIEEYVRSYKYYDSIGTNVAPPEGYNLADFRNQLYATQVKVLFDEPNASKWPEYREELLEKYGGRAVFESYAEQMSAAHGRTITFKDN